MRKTLKLVKVDYDYCDYLRTFDHKVAYNRGLKELRPFIGILFKINNIEYFAPISSPRPKHLKLRNTLDLIKIKDGRLGVINFNNMIPVSAKNYKNLDLDTKFQIEKDVKYQSLLKEQLSWCNANIDEIMSKAYNLYIKYINNKLPSNVKDRCCNYPLLEEKCMEYNIVTQ